MTTTSPGPLYDETTFGRLQDLYREIVPPSEQTIARNPSSGFYVPVKVEQVHGKGRGVLAAQDIAQGTLVWHAVQHALFHQDAFLQFLTHLHDDIRLVCDILMWSYVEKVNQKRVAALELDMGSFLNDGMDSYNLREVYRGFLVAARDIKAGEELTMSYDSIPYDSDLPWYKELKMRANLGEILRKK